MSNLHFIFQRNCRYDERRRLDKSISLSCRQYRTKRIDINVKINGLAYLVEVLGGVVIPSVSFLKPATYLYIMTQIWYGNIIPSCYLVNSSEIKDFIQNHGWLMALSKIYGRKEKNTARSNNNADLENAPERKESQKPVPVASKYNKNEGRGILKRDKCTPSPRIQNESESSNQSNRRRERPITDELSNTLRSNLSAVTRSSQLLKNNFTQQKHKKRKFHKPSIKKSEASVYYICNEESANTYRRPHNVKTSSNIQILLPNQPDYS